MARSQSSPSSLRPPPIHHRSRSGGSLLNAAAAAFDPQPAHGFQQQQSALPQSFLAKESPSSVSAASHRPLSLKELVMLEVRAVSLWMALSLGTLVVLQAVFPSSQPKQDHWSVAVSFFNPLVLVWVQSQTGVMPVWQGRLTEWRLGRLSRCLALPPPQRQQPRREPHPVPVLGLVLLVHSAMATALLTHVLPWVQGTCSWSSGSGAGKIGDSVATTTAPQLPLHQLSPPSWALLRDVVGRDLSAPTDPSVAAPPQPWRWLWDPTQEAFWTALYLVLLLVLPVLLDLNRVPRWSLPFVLYPLYASSFTGASSSSSDPAAPGWSLALLAVAARSSVLSSSTSWWRWLPVLSPDRIVAQALGALAAGEVMAVYFPDDPQF